MATKAAGKKAAKTKAAKAVYAPATDEPVEPDDQRPIWTVMVYLAGDNNLTDECIYALTEMKKAVAGSRVKVIAQLDPQDDYLPTHRYEINRHGKNSSLSDDITDGFPFQNESRKAISVRTPRDIRQNESSTGDPRTLVNFVIFCLEKHPADHYMLIIAGHGSGVETGYLLKDESPAGSLTMGELQFALREVKRRLKIKASQPLVDILGMDVCLMSMAEVCYELNNCAEIVVACESYSPAAGWPYRAILTELTKFTDPAKITALAAAQQRVQDEFAKTIVEEYVKFYADYNLGGLSVDLAALDIRQVDKLKTHAGRLAKGLIEELTNVTTAEAFKSALILAHWDAQSYNGEQFVDIIDFCDCLQARYANTTLASLCQEVREAITSDFILRSCYSGPKYQYSNGVSIYFPWDDVALPYESLDFAQDSGWLEFLQLYTQSTRRRPRGVSGASEDLEANSRSLVRQIRRTEERGKETQIRSMRNPPIAALPSPCKETDEGALQKILSKK